MLLLFVLLLTVVAVLTSRLGSEKETRNGGAYSMVLEYDDLGCPDLHVAE